MWKVSQHNEKPTIYIQEGYSTYSTRELLTLNGPNAYDPRAGRCYKLYYTKLPIPVAELEFRRNVQLQAVFEKFQTAVNIFLKINKILFLGSSCFPGKEWNGGNDFNGSGQKFQFFRKWNSQIEVF